MRKLSILLLPLLLASCQSKWEAIERLADIDAKRNHPKEITNVNATVETEDNFEMKGKARFTLVGKAPQQPYPETNIPDGGQKVADTVKSVTGTAAIVGGAALLHNAGKGGDTTNITNNGGAAQ